MRFGFKTSVFRIENPGFSLAGVGRGWGGGGGGVGVTQESFIPGGSALRSKPLPFHIPFSTGNGTLSYIPSIRNDTPFTSSYHFFIGSA